MKELRWLDANEKMADQLGAGDGISIDIFREGSTEDLAVRSVPS